MQYKIVTLLIFFTSTGFVLDLGAKDSPKEKEVGHFREAEIPRNELRLMALARVREFRCDYDLAQHSPYTVLIAEYYENGKRISVHRLCMAVFDRKLMNKEGVITMGWHRDHRKLIGVHDNGQLYSPWTGSIDLPEFEPSSAHCFTESKAEVRTSELENTTEAYKQYSLYPVMGICGSRNLSIGHMNPSDRKSFIDGCLKANAKNAVMIYLYHSDGGDPPIKYTTTKDSSTAP